MTGQELSKTLDTGSILKSKEVAMTEAAAQQTNRFPRQQQVLDVMAKTKAEFQAMRMQDALRRA